MKEKYYEFELKYNEENNKNDEIRENYVLQYLKYCGNEIIQILKKSLQRRIKMKTKKKMNSIYLKHSME